MSAPSPSSSTSTLPGSSSDLSADAPQSPSAPPPAFPGETFVSTWTDLKFFLAAADAAASAWATLAAFHGTGTAYLSTCRLVFVLEPAPPPDAATPGTLSIPLEWVQRERLRLCRPFFDADHLAGVLVPSDEPDTPSSTSSVFAPPGKPMRFRIQALDPDRNHGLCTALRTLLDDRDRVVRDARALRRAADTRLVRTGSHFAFVDPRYPAVLHLATLMARPDDPAVGPH